jgi:SpoVK/Ycf46/Vps4 family AAA+-type ATPase
MVLDEKLAERLAQVVTEQRQRHRLEEFGLKPMRKLLLMGPPGTGKTMTAFALAGELSLPLLTIQLDGLISRFLGETAAKLRLVFDVMSTRRGVYFFDEFDALGAERGDRQDVGEIRRVLNSFLQFLEQDPSDSLVLAATNHGAMLDRALFRRFDAVLPYTIPTASTAAKVMQARLGFLETSSLDWEIAAQHGHGLSHAELVLACEQAAKQTVLSNRSSLRQSDLEQALERMRSRYPQEMSSFAQ